MHSLCLLTTHKHHFQTFPNEDSLYSIASRYRFVNVINYVCGAQFFGAPICIQQDILTIKESANLASFFGMGLYPFLC